MSDLSCNRVCTIDQLVRHREMALAAGEVVVLTNGCFDILHRGHMEYLSASAKLGDRLFVAINSDRSVTTLKGPDRPVNSHNDRALIVGSLRCVDAVTVFEGPRLTEQILAIRPDIYTKAGDYTVETLDPEERSALDRVGAKIKILPFLANRSTTGIIDRLRSNGSPGRALKHSNSIDRSIDELKQNLEHLRKCIESIQDGGEAIVEALKSGNKLLSCGNGGSAADALHLSEELIGRYSRHRRSLPAICLNADVTAITCIANDYGYDAVFSRAVEGLGSTGDVFVGFSTSGNSVNVVNALEAARIAGLTTIALLGRDGGAAKGKADIEIIIPSDCTARIQELHTFVLHQWLDMVDSQHWGPDLG